MKTWQVFASVLVAAFLLLSCNLLDEPSEPEKTNESPTVTIIENAVSIWDDEEVTLHAQGSDPNGDNLYWTWYVNDVVQAGVTGGEFLFTPSEGVEAVYTIRVSVSDGDFAADSTVSVTVSVRPLENQPPVVAIQESDGNLDWGEEVTLHANASDENIPGLTWEWLVDDAVQEGSTGSTFVFSREPAIETVFTLTVRVSDGEFTADASIDLTVAGPPNLAPTVSITESSTTIAYEGSITLHATASDPEDDNLTYTWKVNGNAQAGTNSDSFIFTSSPTQLTVYSISVSVSDGQNTTESAAVAITVEGPPDLYPPTATADADATAVTTGTLVTLLGSGSDDDGDAITAYAWGLTVPAGSATTLNSTTAQNPTFTPDEAGDYTASLVVTARGVTSEPATVTISARVDVPPVANAGVDQTVDAYLVVTLDGSGSYDPDAEDTVTGYNWTISTAPGGSIATLTGDNTVNPTFIPKITGDYIISLIVTANGLSSAADTVTVSVAEATVYIDSGSVESIEDEDDLLLTAVVSEEYTVGLTFSWFVDDIEQTGETGETFTFSRLPALTTTFTVKARVFIDGEFLAEANIAIEVIVRGAHPTELYSYHDIWVEEALPAPGGALEIDSYDNTLYAFTDEGVLWYYDIGWNTHSFALPIVLPVEPASMAVWNGYLYLASDAGSFYLFDGSWISAPIPDLPGTTSIGVHNGRLCALTESGLLYTYDLDWEVESIDLPDGIVSLADSGSSLLLLADDGTVYTRETDWCSELIAAPAGTVSFTVHDGIWYSLVPE